MPAGPSPFWMNLLSTLVLGLVFVALWRVAGRLLSGTPIVPRRRRRRVPWRLEGAALATMLLLIAWAAYFSGSDSAEPLTIDLGSALAMGLVWTLMGALVVTWLRSSSGATWRDFGAPLSTAEATGDVVLGVLACAAMLVPVYGVQILLVLGAGLPSSHPTVEQLLADPSLETIVAAVLMAVVIAPVLEELAFRVLLQGWFERVGGSRAWWPIGASATLFALAHLGQGWAPVPLAVLALGLGYVYRQTHRLAPVVAMHMAFNALGLAVAVVSAGQGAIVEGPAP